MPYFLCSSILSYATLNMDLSKCLRFHSNLTIICCSHHNRNTRCKIVDKSDICIRANHSVMINVKILRTVYHFICDLLIGIFVYSSNLSRLNRSRDNKGGQ